MSNVFLYPKAITGECFKSQLRIVNKLDIEESDLENGEIIISKDYANNELLLGKPTFEITKYEGRMYEKLIQLNLKHEGTLSFEEKSRIIQFVSQFGAPLGPIGLASQNFNWVFIPYEIDLRRGEGEFFSSFRNLYVDFKDTIEIIKSGDLHLLNRYQGSFNNGLQGNRLYLPPFETGYSIKWINDTCLNLCYLELYELLLSNQKIKVCKYCNSLFESSKSNEVRCKNCKNPAIFRKLYHLRNLTSERLKAKERMRRLRLKKSD